MRRGALALGAIAAVAAAAWLLWPASPEGAHPPTVSATTRASSSPAGRFGRLYQAVRPGMTIEAVEALLGGPGEEIAWRRLHGETLETKVWVDGDGGTIYVTFRDRVAILKSQLGVPDAAVASPGR